MALFKILSGPEKKNSTGVSVMLTPGTSGSPAHHEGWAYVTDEGNLYVDLSSSRRVKIASNTDFAIKAEQDSSGQVITTTYLKGLAFIEANKAVPQLQYTLGSGTTGTLNLPVASSTQGGIITNGAQSIGGAKTFLANVNVNGVFDFVGIKEICQGPSGDSSAPADYWSNDKVSPIWMARQADVSVPYYSNMLGYDYANDILYVDALNKLNTAGTLYVGGASTLVGNTSITGTLSVTGATEIANTLKVTQKVTFNNALDVGGATNLKANVTIGSSSSNTLIVKSATTLQSTLAVTGKVTLANQLVSNVALGTAPFIITSTTKVANLNVDMVDDCHVSNDVFTDANHNQNKIPTQTAVWQSLEGLLRALQGLLYKGVLNPSSGSTTITAPTSPKSGDVYVIGKEGTFSGTSTYVEPGDLVIAYKNSSGTIVWDAIQVNIDGAVRISGGGKASNTHATDHAIARFDGTSGRVIQNSKIIIDDNGNLYPTSNDSQSIGIYNDDTKLRWKEIYAVNFRGLVDRATNDDNNQNIRSTYLIDVNLVDHASKPYYNLINGKNSVKDTAYLPVASEANAGIITADKTTAQTITGSKIIDTNGSLTIQKSSGFIYSGIEVGNSAKARPVWYAHAERNSTPCYNTNFIFNPASSVGWENYDGTSVTAHALLTVTRLKGLAYQALQDDQGFTIKKTYIKALVLKNDASSPKYQYVLGDGTNSGEVNLPVANESNAGVITTKEQTIAGKKIITGGLDIRGAAADHYLITRGIVGSNGNGTIEELYLQYGANSAIKLGNTGAYSISADGSKYSGRAANADSADKATNDASGNAITSYIRGLTLDTSNTSRIFTITYGSGTTTQLKPFFAASSSHGGAATSAVKWSTARTITLAGDATGSVSLDGTANTTLTVTIAATSAAFNSKFLRKDTDDTTGYKLTITNATSPTSSTAAAAFKVTGGATFGGNVYTGKLYNAVWNDYAEFREAETRKPGRVVIEHKSGEMKVSTKRLQPGGLIVSDTFGHAMGQTKKCRTPVAVAGRVLAYPYEDRNSYPLGAAVCTGPGGTVSLMTRAEIREYPERIIGTVSEIPDYETWGQDNVKVNGRIWIKVK